MIVVLADDLSGAAEMGGMAWRYGLTAEVLTLSRGRDRVADVTPGSSADLSVDVLVIDTDSRAYSADEAVQRTRRAADLCGTMPVEWVFKKVDSVLRGHVVAELGALLTHTERQRALLIPANPALGRTIDGGCYLVDGRPLHETDFANDPDFPASTSYVEDLLLERDTLDIARRWPVCVVSFDHPLPGHGIVVGETRSAADLAVWASVISTDVIAAGAADFFGALLAASGRTVIGHEAQHAFGVEPARRLFVCGSTSATSRRFCRESEDRGVPVLRLPPALLETPGRAQSLVSTWAADVISAFQAHSTVIIAIDRPIHRERGLPLRLTYYLREAVAQILEQVVVDHLLVEGGATAAALVRRFGWNRLHVLRELAPGVVSSRVVGNGNLTLTMKPGSYRWPEPWSISPQSGSPGNGSRQPRSL